MAIQGKIREKEGKLRTMRRQGARREMGIAARYGFHQEGLMYCLLSLISVQFTRPLY